MRLRFPSGHATATVISVLHEKVSSEVEVDVSWHTKINSLMYSFAFSSVYVYSPSSKLIVDHYLLFSPYFVVITYLLTLPEKSMPVVLVNVSSIYRPRDYHGFANNALNATRSYSRMGCFGTPCQG